MNTELRTKVIAGLATAILVLIMCILYLMATRVKPEAVLTKKIRSYEPLPPSTLTLYGAPFPYTNASDGPGLSEAKRFAAFRSAEGNAWAKDILRKINSDSDDYPEALWWLAWLANLPHNEKIEAKVAAEIRAAEAVTRKQKISQAMRRDFESAGLHRTPTGRIYQVEVSQSRYAVTYDYSGAISGQVVTNLMGMVLSDTRQFPKE